MQYWLVKQEPSAYSWSDFAKEGRTSWTGVRNNQARLNLIGMKRGDHVLFYHSVSDKAVMGTACVSRQAYHDPTAGDDEKWVCVDLVAKKPLPFPVTLITIKNCSALANIALMRNSRLSVMPLTKPEYDRILKLGGL